MADVACPALYLIKRKPIHGLILNLEPEFAGNNVLIPLTFDRFGNQPFVEQQAVQISERAKK